MTNAVVHAYTEYVRAKKQAKQAQKAELAERIRPQLIALGEAVEEAQAGGTSIAEVARLMGLKYRNIIYDAKRAYAAHAGKEPNVKKIAVRAATEEPQTEQAPTESKDYTIEELGDGSFEVTLWGEDYILNLDDDSGRIVFPDEWADASDGERAVYRQIIREIENR